MKKQEPASAENFIKTYWRLMGSNRSLFGGLVVAHGLSGIMEVGALAVLVPLLVEDDNSSLSTITRFFDNLAGDPASRQRWLLATFVVLGVLSIVMKFVSQAGTFRLKTRIEQSMREQMTDAVWRMRWSSFLEMRLGDLSKGVMLEGDRTAVGVYALTTGAGAVLVCAIFVGLAIAISPPFTLAILMLGGIGSIAYRYGGRKAEIRGAELSDVASGISQTSNQLFSNLKYLRSSGTSGAARRRLGLLYSRYASVYFRVQTYNALLRTFSEALTIVVVGALLFVSLSDSLRPSAGVILFLGLLLRLGPRIQVVQDNLNKARTERPWALAWQQRFDLARQQVDNRHGGTPPRLERALEARDLRFSYAGTPAPAIDGVSWKLPQGGCLGVAGDSGGGKTTMMDLVTGLLKPTAGDIYLDGTPLAAIDVAAWQARIGVVMQDSPVFHASIAENIAWSDEVPNREKVLSSARLAQADDFITSLPDGYSTIVGERGARLSGGQRQRLALARALYAEPWLLLLDEPTSSLDAVSEQGVQKALSLLKGKVTMIVVSHRLHVLELADQIVVMQNGRVVDGGTWSELRARPDGPFASMPLPQH